MPTWNNDTLITAFIALTGFAMLVQAIILFALFLSMRKAANSIKEEIEDLRGSIAPVFNSSREILERIGPKIEPVSLDIVRTAANVKQASADLAEIAHQLRVQTAEVQASAEEVVDRLRNQAARIDGMVTGVLDVADQAGEFVQSAIRQPARQLSGLLAAAKAVVETLRAPEASYRQPRSSSYRPPGDKDMFV